MNVRLRMFKYCYLNIGAIYGKGLSQTLSKVDPRLSLWQKCIELGIEAEHYESRYTIIMQSGQ